MKKQLILGLLCSMMICGTLAVSCKKDPKPSEVYSITVTNDGNGTAEADPATASQGATVTLTAKPADGYLFEKWTVVGGDAELTSPTANPTTFTMPAKNVEIKAWFTATEEVYSITVTNDGNGTAEADPATASQGATVTLTAKPADGYLFEKWTVVGGDAELTSPTANPATFTMPAKNVEIKAWFTAPQLEPSGYYQINDGEKQDILSSTFAFEEGAGYAFAVSPMNLTDRTPDQMEKRLFFTIPIELMGKEIDLAETKLIGKEWFLAVKLNKEFLNSSVYNGNSSVKTTGHIKVVRGENDNFVIDFTNVIFPDGTKLGMHYEGKINKRKKYDVSMQYTAVLATYDMQVGDNETVKTQTVGYIANLTGKAKDGKTVISNVWGSINTPYSFFDIYLSDPKGGNFTDGTYVYTNGSKSDLQFEGSFETTNISGWFMDESNGKVAFSKTASSFTLQYTDVTVLNEKTDPETEIVINGTITCDIKAPLTGVASPKHGSGHTKHTPNKINRMK